jgi:hypothetical protein
MKRILLVLAIAALMTAMLGASALPALADAGGVPNDNACHGQVIKFSNQAGFTPNVGAEFLGQDNAGEWNKAAKEGLVIAEDANGVTHSC